MKKLWSAANVKVYGGGVSEAAFLEDLSRIVGDYDRQASSVSYRRGHRTVSSSCTANASSTSPTSPPCRRAAPSSSPRAHAPTLIRTQPWMTGPRAEAVRASIKAHDPQGMRTIVDT